MILAYYRLGKYDDARRSMQQLLTFANDFRMDNPLVDFGRQVYQPKQPINLCYDSSGPPAAMIRGLFEYVYQADHLTLYPHIPPTITSLEQKFPIRFGHKKIFLRTIGQGEIVSVLVNVDSVKTFAKTWLKLYDKDLPSRACVAIHLGGSRNDKVRHTDVRQEIVRLLYPLADNVVAYADSLEQIETFYQNLNAHNLSDCYAAKHAAVVIHAANAATKRQQELGYGRFSRLPEPARSAADQVYSETVPKLFRGLAKEMTRYENSSDETKQVIYNFWKQSAR